MHIITQHAESLKHMNASSTMLTHLTWVQKSNRLRLRPNKKDELFPRHGRICLKLPGHYIFLLLSENKNEIKKAFPVQNIVISKVNAFPLGCCGPLLVTLYSLFIPASISSWIAPNFSTVYVRYGALTV